MRAGAPLRSGLLLGRYDADALLGMFADAGVLDALGERGFSGFDVVIDDSSPPLTHTRLLADKAGARHLLVDACLTEVHLQPGQFERGGFPGDTALDLIVAYWLREQDPTASFAPDHARLPLQDHPGLGVLKDVFQVALRIARDIGKDGIAALPKFFHDAAIFYRSRLFLFLDPVEQGRFEALTRDLAGLPLADATLALAGGAVRDGQGDVAEWTGGFQVMPLGPALADYFNGADYQRRCREAVGSSRFTVDPDALEHARQVFARDGAG